MRRTAAVATRLALVLAGVAAGLGLVEGALRLRPPPAGTELRALHVLRPDRPWVYGMRPGAVIESADGVRYAVNAAGFRDRDVPRAKPAGTYRVVALGDSLTFGYAVPAEAAFPRQLEHRLAAARTGPRVEVLNLGVSGYNPWTEAALLADVGVGYAPDLVLVQFCVNDLNDPTMHFDASTAIRLAELPDAAFPDPASRRPTAARRTLRCPGLRLCALLEDLLFPRAPRDPEALRAGLVARADPTPTEMAWLAARYGDLDRAARGIGARVALVVFPFQSQLAADAPDALQRKLVALAHGLGWTAVDLLGPFRAAAARGERLFVDPWHPTAAGYRVAAEATADQLACGGGVPVARPAGCASP